MKLYLVKKYIRHGEFEDCGIFDSEKSALKACLNWRYGYTTFELNEEIENGDQYHSEEIYLIYPYRATTKEWEEYHAVL